MLQNTRKQPGEERGKSDHSRSENQERKNYEGFEGMNYEQERKPYPRNTNNSRQNDDNDNWQRGGDC